MVECNVLKFGSFTLKSGRQSPFFMNAGAYITGIQLKTLGRFYAEAIHENFDEEPDVFLKTIKKHNFSLITNIKM